MWVQSLGGLHFPNDTSEVSVEIKYYPSGAQFPCARALSCWYFLVVFPGCARRQFSECQPDGEHHEAPERTTPVPLGFAQTVCLFR